MWRLFKECLSFAWREKKWWLIPLIVVLVIFMPRGVIGTFLGWKLRKDTAAARANDPRAGSKVAPGAAAGPPLAGCLNGEGAHNVLNGRVRK